MLNEGQHNKTALKMVFLAGGPGSGKNYVAEKLFGIQPGSSFSADGFKLVSFDRIYVNMLKQHGYDPAKLHELPPEELHKVTNPHDPESLYGKCRVLMKKQLKDNLKAGNGIIFDGTGQMGYQDKQHIAKEMGYDTYLLYVDAPLETALARNAARSRRLPDHIVSQVYRAVKNQKHWFKKDFGPNMIEINNGDHAEPISSDVMKKVHEIVNGPVQNKKGKYFLKTGKRPWLTAPKPKLPKDIDPNKKTHSYNPTKNDYWSYKGGQGNFFGYGGKYQSSTKNPNDASYYSKDWTPPKKPSGEPTNSPVNTDWVSRFKQKQAEKDAQRPSKPVSEPTATPTPPQENPPSKEHPLIKDRKIHNPETGNDIYLRTALHYPLNHPMRKAAEAEREKIQAQNKKPSQ